MNICSSVSELIGGTPLLRIRNFEKKEGLGAALCVKIEGMNPAGSAKDRVAREMLDEAERSGKLKKGAVIIEPTSGNTGIGLAAVAASRGYRAIFTMPDTMSEERRKLLRAYGAEIVLTEGSRGMAGAIERANELASEIPDSFIPGQFTNPANPDAHYKTTGPEIYADTDGVVDVFVASVGTGGTITGCGRYLKEKKPAIRVVAVEPADSPVLSGGRPGPHKLQGIGAGFIPETLDTGIYDEVIPVTTESAYRMARTLAVTEGVLVGISSGATLWAAAEVARRPENAGKTVVALLTDTGERYLSGDLFE